MTGPVRVEALRVVRDARGWVAEPLDDGSFAAQHNVHMVVSEPGVVRGNHWHRHGTEVLTVAGPALVRTRHGNEVSDTEVPPGAVFRFTFPPGVSHAIQNTGTAPLVMVAFNTCPHDPADPDVVPDRILEWAPAAPDHRI